MSILPETTPRRLSSAGQRGIALAIGGTTIFEFALCAMALDVEDWGAAALYGLITAFDLWLLVWATADRWELTSRTLSGYATAPRYFLSFKRAQRAADQLHDDFPFLISTIRRADRAPKH